MSKLADFIREQRKARDLTQEELAELMGMSYGYVGQLETGLVKRPRPATLRKLAEALQVSLDDLAVATDQLDVRRDDVEAELIRVAGLPAGPVRRAAWRSLSKELRRAILLLAQDVFREVAEQQEEE